MDAMLDELAVRFIFQDTPKKLPYSKIYGIARTGNATRPVLEVYHQTQLKAADFQQLFQANHTNYTVVSIPTAEFYPFVLHSGSAIRYDGAENFGTLGGVVREKDTGQVCLLSNHHVLSPQPFSKETAVLSVPSNKVIAHLTRAVPLKHAPEKNQVDAAIAKVLPDLSINEYPDFQVAKLQKVQGSRVYKLGAASGKTWGTVISQNSAIRVNYGKRGTLYFENSLVIRGDQGDTFSKPGDSGSLVFDEDGGVVALLYAGDAYSNIAFACPIQAVLDALEVQF